MREDHGGTEGDTTKKKDRRTHRVSPLLSHDERGESPAPGGNRRPEVDGKAADVSM